MKSKHLALPKKKYEYGYDLAYELASKHLAGITDIAEQCWKSSTQYQPPGEIMVTYLNQNCLIHSPDGQVTLASGEDTLPVKEKLLVLHYFLQAKGTTATGELVTYKELKEGVNYFPIFYERAIKPLVNFFGNQPQLLPEIAASLGGEKASYGDYAASFNAFPRVPVTFVLWKGDEEFPPEGSILFDSSVSDYLTNDDIHALCETIAWKLVRTLKSGR
ncbi:DUF3786 domain-containing protein [Chloroflexota bacterium]